MAEGFDDFEMKNRNYEEDDHNWSINTENPKYERVEIPDVKKDTGSMRKSLTSDRKKSFEKIFNLNLEKKNGPNNSILLDNTVFVRDLSGNVSIEFKGNKIGNVNSNLEPELFGRKQ